MELCENTNRLKVSLCVRILILAAVFETPVKSLNKASLLAVLSSAYLKQQPHARLADDGLDFEVSCNQNVMLDFDEKDKPTNEKRHREQVSFAATAGLCPGIDRRQNDSVARPSKCRHDEQPSQGALH